MGCPQPAGAAALPNLVDPADLHTASVLSGASWGTMLAVGAALGGLVAGTLGTTACFVLDAALLLLAAGLTAATTRPSAFETILLVTTRMSPSAGRSSSAAAATFSIAWAWSIRLRPASVSA